MLKHMLLNKKKVPVPVPVRTLGEALAWLEQTLLSAEHTITKVVLDDRELDLSAMPVNAWTEIGLSPTSQLFVQADSPTELAVQTIDALRNLVGVLERTIKPLAVAFWQTLAKDQPRDLATLQSDLALILDLGEHLSCLVQERVSFARAGAVIDGIKEMKVALAMAIADSDWKSAARVLLNRLEPALVGLNQELSALQRALFDLAAETAWRARSLPAAAKSKS